MKNFKLASLFILGASLLSLPAMAQSPARQTAEKAQACVNSDKCLKGEAKCDKQNPQCDKGACGKTKCSKADCKNTNCQNPACKGFKSGESQKCDKRGAVCKRNDNYSNLNISDAQRSRLQALDMRRDSLRRAGRQQMDKQKRDTVQRNDSAFRAARIAETRSYLEEVKAIVGPDQYVVFLEDFYVNSPANGRGKAINKDGRFRMDKRHAKISDRGRKAFKDSKNRMAKAGKDAKTPIRAEKK